MKIKILLILFLIYKFLFNQVFAEILFSEILPNTDDDTNLEYIELYNSGNLEQNLDGFILKDKSDKEYIFNSGSILSANEKKKYYRIETKILLNNSNEELFLYDNFGNLIDSFNYSSSIKNELILILNNDDLVGENDNGIIEEENNIDLGNILIDIPEIKFSFQSPTYLVEKDKIISIYNCDSNKEVCKINLDFRNSFIGDFNESDYECITDFSFVTGEENKCNPSSFLVPLGNYTFNIKIQNKNDTSNFTEKQFQIINNGYMETIDEGYDYLKKKKKKNTGIPPVIIKKPKIIVESGLNNDKICSNKNNCNINFKYIEKSKFEKCSWDFGGGKFLPGINTKCNPSYVKYGTGEYIVKLRVFERGDYYNFKESRFVFGEKEKSLIQFSPPGRNEAAVGEIDDEKKESPIITFNKEDELQEKEAAINNNKDNIYSVINIQGKIGKNKTINGNILTCYDNCSVNFDGSLSGGNIKRYSWDFGNGERYEGKNPGYIKYETPGNYKIYLLAEGENGGMDIGEFYVNFIDDEEEENPPILNSFPLEEKEAAVYSDENVVDDNKSVGNNDSEVIVLLYILIGIFGIILVVLILRKESLL